MLLSQFKTKSSFKLNANGENGGYGYVYVEIVDDKEISLPVSEQHLQDGMIRDFSTFSDVEVKEFAEFMERALARSNERLGRYTNNLNNEYYAVVNLPRGIRLENETRSGITTQLDIIRSELHVREANQVEQNDNIPLSKSLRDLRRSRNKKN
jgi:hypothetical protein